MNDQPIYSIQVRQHRDDPMPEPLNEYRSNWRHARTDALEEMRRCKFPVHTIIEVVDAVTGEIKWSREVSYEWGSMRMV